MKKSIYILFFITAFCQGQIINSYAYTAYSTTIDVFTQDNAAATSDNNSIGYLTTSSSASLAVESTIIYDGSYSIKLTSSNAQRWMYLRFDVVAGKNYDISIWARLDATNSGSAPANNYFQIQNSGLLTSSFVPFGSTLNTSTFVESTYSNIAVGTGLQEIRCFAGLNAGDIIFLDKITIIETD